MQPIRNTETTRYHEGHCMQFRQHEEKASCTICDEKSDDGLYRCSGMFDPRLTQKVILT